MKTKRKKIIIKNYTKRITVVEYLYRCLDIQGNKTIKTFKEN